MENDKVPIITTKNLRFAYRKGGNTTEVIRDLSLSISKGEFVSFIGPSGCGKTTLLRLFADLEKPDSGEIRVNGKTPYQARLDHDFSFMFQQAALLEWRTALANVMLPVELSNSKVSANDKKVAQQLFEQVGLKGFEKHYPRQLSGGMKQRVSLARSLVLQPPLLFMDEPFGALDEITRVRMNYELLKMWEISGATIVFITHNIREAVLLSDRIFVLLSQPGRLLEVIDINLPRPRTNDLLDTDAFNDYHVYGEKLIEEAILECQ